MKSNAGLYSSCKTILIITLMIFLLPASLTFAMQPLDNSEMEDIYAGQGFARFTINDLPDDITEIDFWFNINTSQHTEIESLKLGWNERYEDGNPDPLYKWDHEWSNVEIGKPDEYFITEGLYFKAEFKDYETNSPRLMSLTFGVDYAKGDITADFKSFSGVINHPVSGPEFNRNENLGQGTLRVGVDETVRGGFELSINVYEPTYGFWMTFDNAQFTP